MPWPDGSARFQSVSLISVPDAQGPQRARAESGSGFSAGLCRGLPGLRYLIFPACSNFPRLVHAPIPRLGSDWCSRGATHSGTMELMASLPCLAVAVWGLPDIKFGN